MQYHWSKSPCTDTLECVRVTKKNEAGVLSPSQSSTLVKSHCMQQLSVRACSDYRDRPSCSPKCPWSRNCSSPSLHSKHKPSSWTRKTFPIHAHLSTVHHNVGPTYIAHDSRPTRSRLHAQPSPNAGLLAVEAPRLHHSMYGIGNMNESVELH